MSQPPNIVNIINFVRAVEPRDASIDLLLPVRKQMELALRHGLPVTWLVQYDTLCDERFTELIKRQAPPSHEVGGWYEIVEPQARAAGIEWRGRYPWDWHCHVGFSVGYTPAEREKLADAFMHKFHEVFGQYPASVGSWFIDAHTLAYMQRHYGVCASCNCKDQRGTDGYTLWGGYWNQAYYPSLANAYMPAQNPLAQIDMPVFRMLGSDPIYQYDAGEPGKPQPVVTLEPVYGSAGADPAWVEWFFRQICRDPRLTFGYAQVGQENSFGWPAMEKGLSHQFAVLDKLVRSGNIRVETLQASAQWFRERYDVTPASAVVALDDWKNEGNRAAWYCSRFYRAGFLWHGETFLLRDLHLFDETYAEPHLVQPCTSEACVFDTLPVFDGASWQAPDYPRGMTIVDEAGKPVALRTDDLQIRQTSPDTIEMVCPARDGGVVAVDCSTNALTVKLTMDKWALSLPVPNSADTVLEDVRTDCLCYRHKGFAYKVGLQASSVAKIPGALLILPQDGSVSVVVG